MDSPAALVDAATADLHSAVESAARWGVGSLDVCRESLARSVERVETVVHCLASDPALGAPETRRSLSRFRAELETYGTLHQAAGIFCADWCRALLGAGGEAYGPHGTQAAMRSAGRRVSVEA